MMNNIKKYLIGNLKNIPGWKTNKKIIVFESDDWGSERVRDVKHANKLVEERIITLIQNDKIAYLDGLERENDIEALGDLFSSVTSQEGRMPVFTPFMNMGNPDYEYIKKNEYQIFNWKGLEQTYSDDGSGKHLKLLTNLISEGLFEPQLHGREHLNSIAWMESYNINPKLFLKAFELNFANITVPGNPKVLNGLRASYFVGRKKDLAFIQKSLEDAVAEFSKTFGYSSTVFDAPNAVFHKELEKTLSKVGIKSIVTPFYRNEPDFNGSVNKSPRYGFGDRNSNGQIYHIRNCMFEPYKGVQPETTMGMINMCFRWNKPAVISTHRVNYTGRVDESMRDNSLKALKSLLTLIVKKWPDVEFMSSGQLSLLMHKELS